MSSENPYAAPQTESVPPPKSDRDDLRRIAKAQRNTNLAVLLYLCLFPFNIVLSLISQGAPWAAFISIPAVFGVIVLGGISVFSLVAELRNRTIAVFYVVGLLVPLFGLLLLVSVSGEATRILRENGIKVGLLGANPDDV